MWGLLVLGLEPKPHRDGILNPARLPISPHEFKLTRVGANAPLTALKTIKKEQSYYERIQDKV